MLLVCLVFAQTRSHGQTWELDDPFGTGATTGQSQGVAKPHPETNDPCQAPPKGEQTWALLDVVDQALCRNPKTRQAWANARFQAAQVGVNQAAYLPGLTVTTTVTRSENSSSSLSGGQQLSAAQTQGSVGSSSREQTRITPQISMNYLLFDFGGREAKLENAQRALDAANWSHDAALQTVMLAAIQAYYQVFATQAAAESTHIAESSSEEALKAAKLRHEVGAAALADALQAQTAYAQAKLNRQKADNDARIALGTLANALGLEADHSMKIAPPALAKPDAERDDDVHRLIQQAKAFRPDLAAAEAQIRAAEANVEAAKSNSLPTVSLVGNYAYSNSSVFNDVQSWSVGLQLSVPLFTGFANTYQIRSAEEQVEVHKATREQLDQTVALDVWRAYHNLNTARETYQSSEDLVASATQSEKVALGRYKAGAGNILDLLNAQASLANARVQKIQAQYTWLTQKATLAQALGSLDLSRVDAWSTHEEKNRN